LLQDTGIIRNRLKIDAAIHNAAVVLQLQKQFGSFKNWLEHHHPKTREEWLPLFKKNLPLYGRRNRKRIPDEYGLFAKCAPPVLPCI
jgi:DNA-3-methyladenine glycosylase I